MRYSDSTKNLFAALLRFQDEVDPILKDASNPHFKSKYAKLESCIAVTQPTLKECGLVVIQPTSFIDGIVILHTRVTHVSSGEWFESDWPLIPAKNDPQGLGSANTYGRRYNYLSTLGLSAESDDDANRATFGDTGAGNASNKLRALSYAPSDPRDYVIKIGQRNLNKRMRDVPIEDLRWAMNHYSKKNPRSEAEEEFLKQGAAFLGAEIEERPY